MSVLIKDMEKPEFCYAIIDGEFEYCPFVNTDDDCVLLLKKGICESTWEEQYSKCPLTRVPEPCEDAVSRQGAIDAIGEVHPLDYNAQAIKSRIEKLPPVQSKKFYEVLRDMMDEDYYLFCHTGYSRLAEKDWEWLIEQVKEIEQSEKENR